MIHAVFRVWLLWGVLTILVMWLFGFNQWFRLWEVVEVSTPQVEAFAAGITSIGWRQLPFVLLAFFSRRAVILSTKKAIKFVLIILLETHWRRTFNKAMKKPVYYTVKGWRKVIKWRRLNNFLFLHYWFLYFYTASMLTLATFIWSEFMLALIRGSLALPPIVVQYQAQLITFAIAFFASTLAQYFLLFIWVRIYHLLPRQIHQIIEYMRWPVFRRLVKLRGYRRSLTQAIFSWRSFVFMLVVILCASVPN